MKTPREILLARHKAADTKLDAVRHTVVAELNAKTPRREDARFEVAARESASPPRVFAPLRLCVEKVWLELLWPCRRTWSALAAVWLAVLVFNHAQAESGPAVVARSSAPPAEIRLALREQHRVLEEILGPKILVTPAEPPRRPNHQPRSDRRSLGMA